MSKSSDREWEQQFKKSLQVSSRMDEIIDQIYNKQPIQEGTVPNYNSDSSGSNVQLSGSNESSSLFHLDNDVMLKTAATALGHEGISAIIGSAVPTMEPDNIPDATDHQPVKPQFKISKNQYVALKKYPALIEFLGTEGGISLVKEIAAKVNVHLVKKIEANSKEVSKYAQVCVADKQNIKQYFAGTNNEWVCIVTASGPFRGDEAIFYHPDKEQSFILRKTDSDYTDITSSFNVIHQVANAIEENNNV